MRLTSVSRKLLVLVCILGLTACASKKVEPVDETTLAEQQAIARQQAFAEALNLLKDGELEDARARFQTLHVQQPELSGPLANLGVIAIKMDDREKAVEYFDKVLALNPEHVQALNYRGVLAREQGAFAEAETYYRKALTIEPEHLPSLRNLAILLDLYQGRLQEALALYEQYQSLLPEANPKVKDWIFDIKNRIGDS